MADTVDITAGTGTTIATDDVGGTHYQEIKVVDGTKDSATPVAVDVGVKANALRVAPANDITDGTYIGDINFGEALPAGTNAIGKLAANTGVDIGDVDVTSVPAPLNVVGGGTEAAALRVTVANDSTGLVSVDDGGGSLTVDVGTALPAGTNAIGKLAANTGVDIGDVDVTSVPAPLNVVGGGTEAAALRVTVANDSTGLVSVDDGGGSLTVDVGTALPAGTNAIGKLAANTGVDIGDVDVTSVVPGVAATNLGKAEDAAHASGDVGVAAMSVRANSATALSGADNDYQPLITDTNGRLHVLDQNSAAIAESLAILDDWDDSDFCNVNLNLAGTDAAGGEGVIDAQTQRVTIATDDDGVAHLATIASDTTNIETAIQIMDDWDATHASAAPADGAQVMGAAYSTGLPTDVGADADAARICTDRYGRILPGIMPQKFNAVYDSADASAEGETVKAKTASRKIYILSCVISSDVEGWIKLQDEDSNALTGKMWLKAGGGMALTFPDSSPLVLDTVNKDLEVIAEGAGNVSVTVTGYLAV
ncbi:MAG: hypothetical protein GY832_11580 [Chloroflexi bacterium]|nr:hypothetical protein [Chloroflexota bacterium]